MEPDEGGMGLSRLQDDQERERSEVMHDMQDCGEVLATIDGVVYLAISGVLRIAPDGQQEWYCERAAWAQTEAAKLATRDQRIAELEAELAQLRGADGEASGNFTCPECGSTHKNERALRIHMTRAHGKRPDGTPIGAQRNGVPLREPAMVPCPECGKMFREGQALALHRANAHGLRGRGLGRLNGTGREGETAAGTQEQDIRDDTEGE